MPNNLHIKNLLLWKQDVYAKAIDVYAALRTKESGMTTCQVECEKMQGWWNRELVFCSHELRRVEETSEGVQESLWVVAPIIILILIIIVFVYHSFNFN
jgi:hypothetical protein